MKDGTPLRFEPQHYHYSYGPHEPVLHIAPGTVIDTSTADALNIDANGQEIPRDRRRVRPDAPFREVNPLTGPFFVEGSEPGDAISVRIRGIELTRDWVEGNAGYDRGGLAWGIAAGTSLSPPGFQPPRREYRWKIDRERGTGSVDLSSSRCGTTVISLNPHIGCIGVAPTGGQFISSSTPGAFGGNMDCVETAPGTTVHLPVSVAGAYLFVGDVHAAQGDGELCGGGLDISSRLTLEIDLVKSAGVGWPRLENDSYIMVAASARPLLDAYRLAQVELIRWLETGFGYDPLDALHLITQVGESRIGNVVDPQYTVVAKFPKRYLPPA